MSKRDNEGEVISNKLAVAAAQQHQALFASLAGAPDASLFDSPSTEESNDHDLQDVYVDDEQYVKPSAAWYFSSGFALIWHA